MKNAMLQKVSSSSSNQQGSGNGLKILLYFVSLAVAFYFGMRFSESRLSLPQQARIIEQPADTAPVASPAPIQAQVPTPSAPQTAVPAPAPLAQQPAAVSTPAAVSAPSTPAQVAPATASVSTPVKQSNQVTVTEPVQIPVKQGDKTVGYINLQKGQIITPVAVEQDRIKIKCGDNFVYVPVKSTDMAAR